MKIFPTKNISIKKEIDKFLIQLTFAIPRWFLAYVSRCTKGIESPGSYAPKIKNKHFNWGLESKRGT